MSRRDQLLLGSIWNNKKQAQCCDTLGGGGLIVLTSGDFDGDGVTVSDTRLLGKHYEIFLNELNRFLYSGTEYNALAGGFEITLPGFDASTSSYHLFIFIK